MKSTHAKCGATTEHAGRTLICWKSPEHTKSRDPHRRKHHDPSAYEWWTDKENA